MSVKPEQAKAALLEAVLARVREKLPEPQAAHVERFVHAYYERLAPEDVLERSPLDLYGAALAHWNLARRRKPAETNVHVYNPSFEEHGWQSTHTVVEIVTDDMPFLVDSVSMELARRGSAVHVVIHPVVRVSRDGEGKLLALLPPDSGEGVAESMMHVEIDRQSEPRLIEELQADLLRVLADVRAAVEDWLEMRQRTRDIREKLEREPPPVDGEELAEAAALLEWMEDDHFTFLGYREYELGSEEGQDVLHAIPASGLGILREDGEQGAPSHSFKRLPPEVRRLARARKLLNLTKANSRSTVHRPSYLDYVGVKRFDSDGEVAAERRFLGLYTHTAYNASPWQIPVLRRKVQRVLDRSGLAPGSHDGKALVEILETYPRDELFQISEDELYENALAILQLGERSRVKLLVRRDLYGRFLSCLVYLPRERYNTDSRLRIQQILQDVFGGVSVDHTARVSESVLARLHVVIYTPAGSAPEYDVAGIERRLAEAIRSWTDDLRDALVEQLGEERGSRLFRRWGTGFPAAYQEDVPARAAVPDVNRIEHLAGPDELGMSLHLPLEAAGGSLRFKLLRRGRPILLSDVLPLLENMGVKVVDERPYEIEPPDGEPVWIYDFGLAYAQAAELEADTIRRGFQDCFFQVWRGSIENDGFNRLVLGAGLGWREIAVLRAISKYLRQTGITFSQAYMEETLAVHPALARQLLELFRLRLDPARGRGADAKARALTGEIEQALDAVASLDQDRILRSFLGVVQATLRTNYSQRGPGGEPKPYLSLKLDPHLVPDLPAPRPMFEIFVYSPRVEGVHLRGGKVARGGIRWSDRREDFRTEILGLMKAQTVKNAQIVPVGAKGGFVVKQPPESAEALREEVVACYEVLVRGLLDVTDNIVGDQVVPPPDVVRHDGNDPYLVVAADKGTATFSDIANAIAEEYGFWLGDAFASGGSTGYDHKQMGITARGAWESVRRHFREVGIDVDDTDFTAVGIGDMSGDVFGNGMLLARRMKLVGAFDHRHVFLDPDPDPDASYAERERLFRLPASSWDDYDRGLLSPGGGIFPRSAKSIALSSQVRAKLGVEAEAMTPNEVIRALLRAPVDLLWNGGIGTYVKARDERHADVGDRTNDAVRVDAEELRCWVVGEGGNLGFTQRGRIAYALGGGKIYMDAIDNSGGVDCSDHEVNIKILLDAVVAEGDLTEKQRNALLAEMEDEVGALVLRDNYEQAQAISNSLAQAASMIDVHARVSRALEHTGILHRELEFLPDDEALAERKAAGRGLTAPELAVLLAYAKIALSQQLLASDVPDDPSLSDELERYFPTALRARFRRRMQRHRLRREIVAAQLTNAIVNGVGSTFVFRLAEDTGAAASEIALAFVAAREVFGLRDLWEQIDALDDRVPARTQIAMLLRSRILAERATRWLIRRRRRPLEVAEAVSRFQAGASELARAIPALLGTVERQAARSEAEELAGAGVPPELAARVAHLEELVPALDIVETASATGLPLVEVAETYFALADRLELHWLRDQISALPRETRWESLARGALRDDLYAEQAELTAELLRAEGDGLGVAERIDRWLSGHAAAVDRCLQMLAEVRAGATFDLPTLSVVVREIRNLIQATAAAPPMLPAAEVRTTPAAVDGS